MKKTILGMGMLFVVSLSVCMASPPSNITINNNGYTSEYESTEVTFTAELENESCTMDTSSIIWSQIDPTFPDSLYATSKTGVDLIFDLPDVDSDTNYTYNVKADVDCGGGYSSESDNIIIEVKNIPEPTVDARDGGTVYIGETVELTGTVTGVMSGCTESYQWNETSLNGITIYYPTSLTGAYFETDTMSDGDSVGIDLTVNLTGCVQQGSYLDNLYLFIEEEIIVDAGEDQSKEPTESVNLSGSVSGIGEFCDVTYSWTETSSYGVVISGANSLTGAGFDTSALTGGNSVDIQLSVEVNSCSDSGTYTDNVTVNINSSTPVELDAGDNQYGGNGDVISLSGSLSGLNDNCSYSAYWSELSSFGTVISGSTNLTGASVYITGFNGGEQLEYLLSVNVYNCLDRGTYTGTTQLDIKGPATVDVNILTGTTKNYIGDNVSLTGSLTGFSDNCTANYQRQETTGYGVQITNPNNITGATFTANSLTGTIDISMKFTATLSGCYEAGEFSDYQQFTIYENPVVDAGLDQQVDIGEIVNLSGSVDGLDSGICSVTYSWVENTSFGISISNSSSLTGASFEVSGFNGGESIPINLSVNVDDCIQIKSYQDSLIVEINQPEQEENNNQGSTSGGGGGGGSYYTSPVIKTPKEEQQKIEQVDQNEEEQQQEQEKKEDNKENPLDQFNVTCISDKKKISYDDIFENESYKYKPGLVVKCPNYCNSINYGDLVGEYDEMDYLYMSFDFEVNCGECRSVDYEDVVYEVGDIDRGGNYMDYGFSCNECKNVDFDDIFDNDK